MNGIEKITDKILSDARDFEKESLSQTENQVNDIKEKYESDAAFIEAKIINKANKDAEDLLLKAHSSSELLKRNSVLAAKSKLINQAFIEAHNTFMNLPQVKYLNFLTDLLYHALTSQIKEECEYNKFYDDDKYSNITSYEVILNEKDMLEIGEKLIKNIYDMLGKSNISLNDKRCVLSDTKAKIDGGFILKCGDIETNCSIELIIAQLHDTTASMVYKALFEN